MEATQVFFTASTVKSDALGKESAMRLEAPLFADS